MPYFLIPRSEQPYGSHAEAVAAGQQIDVIEAMNRLLNADDSGQGAVTAALGVGRVMLLMENQLLTLDSNHSLLWIPPQHKPDDSAIREKTSHR